MIPVKVIMGLAMMMSSLAVALPEPIPMALPAALPEAAPVAVPEAKELVIPLQACLAVGVSCKVATLSCCSPYLCMTTGSLSGTCQLPILVVSTTTKATTTAKVA